MFRHTKFWCFAFDSILFRPRQTNAFKFSWTRLEMRITLQNLYFTSGRYFESFHSSGFINNFHFSFWHWPRSKSRLQWKLCWHLALHLVVHVAFDEDDKDKDWDKDKDKQLPFTLRVSVMAFIKKYHHIYGGSTALQHCLHCLHCL